LYISLILANSLVIHELEEQLHYVPLAESLESSIPRIRTTRGVDNSSKYLDILPRKLREERAQEYDAATELKSREINVSSILYSLLILVYFKLERS
jgi:hypothetical protein